MLPFFAEVCSLGGNQVAIFVVLTAFSSVADAAVDVGGVIGGYPSTHIFGVSQNLPIQNKLFLQGTIIHLVALVEVVRSQPQHVTFCKI